MSAGIEDEPALFAAARTGDAGADAIGGEAVLADAWREAKKGLSAFSAPAVTPYLGVAMVIHGLYNAVAMIFSLAE